MQQKRMAGILVQLPVLGVQEQWGRSLVPTAAAAVAASSKPPFCNATATLVRASKLQP